MNRTLDCMNSWENSHNAEKRRRGLEIICVIIRYIHSTRTVVDRESLYKKLDNLFHLDIQNESCLRPTEPVVIIANHPKLVPELLVSNQIMGWVGHPERFLQHKDSHAVANIIITFVISRICRELEVENHITIGRSFGVDNLAESMSCSMIGNRVGLKEVYRSLDTKPDHSICIFPEGGVKNLNVFDRGYLAIALRQNIGVIIPTVWNQLLLPDGEFRVVIHDPIKLQADLNSKKTRSLNTIIHQKMQQMAVDAGVYSDLNH